MRAGVVTCVLLASALVVACGDDGPPVCPTGDCTLPGNTIVKYKFNNYPDLGFDSDTCSELSVAMVRVEVGGIEDTTVYDLREVQCPEGQVTFSDLPVQNYNVVVTPLDSNGDALVSTPANGMVAAAGPGGRSEVSINVQYEAWARAYTGQFLFKLSWAGAPCVTSGTGVVTQHRLTLTVNGVVVTQRTTNPLDFPVDGNADIPCVPSTGMPLTIPMVPWGPATLRVVGKDDADTMISDHTFDTFVGAGLFNPTLTFDTLP